MSVPKYKNDAHLQPAYGYDIPLNELYKVLNTSEKGISDEEVEKRRLIFGSNEIPQIKGSLWQVYFAPLFDTLITVYLIMTAVMLFLSIFLIIVANDYSNVTQAGQWLVVVIINFVIAIVQQNRAQKKMDALQKLSVGTVKAIRDGSSSEINVSELVPGDVIDLDTGSSIPADCRIINSANLSVDEASLTGESVPAEKVEDGNEIVSFETPIGERHNMVFRGCFIQTGKCKAIVVSTGPKTEIGKINEDLAKLNTGEIPLRKKVNLLGKYLSITMVVFLFFLTTFTLINLLPQEQWVARDLVQRFINNIVTAMSIMPINIPLLTTIVLITGVLSMASHKVVIRNLQGVESLGRISVLASDKTGTITKSEMTVKKIWDGTQLFGVTGLGYSPDGQIFSTKTVDHVEEDGLNSKKVEIESGSTLEMLLISGIINNDAEILIENIDGKEALQRWKAVGSPTDASILALFDKSGLDKNNIFQYYTVVKEYPFDSSVKRMSKIVKLNDSSKHLLFCKGASEVLLDKLSRYGKLSDKKSINQKKKGEIKEIVDTYAEKGYRVLMFTAKELDGVPKKSKDEREKAEQDLTFLGIVAVLDPPREGVKGAVSSALSAGITPIMITGDSPKTAGTIAREVGMLSNSQEVHEGTEIKYLSDDAFFNTTVFARVSPQHKQIIVERYQSKNKVVAMTGDGVNDALALSMSDAGICMGITGTDVAKQASDIVITDDSYVSIVTGVSQGRSLFQKIRLMIMFYIGVNLAEGLVYFLASFVENFVVNGFFLLDTWQRIYIFSIVHSIPPMALIFDRAPKDIMNRTPIDTAGIFNKQMLVAMLSFSLILSVMLYIVYSGSYSGLIGFNEVNASYSPELNIAFQDSNNALWPVNQAQLKARTMLLSVIYIAEPLFVLSIRRIDKSLIRSLKEDRFWLAYLLVFSMPVFHVINMYVPFIQGTLNSLLGFRFDVIPLDIFDWLIVLIAGSIPIISLELYKKRNRLKGQYF